MNINFYTPYIEGKLFLNSASSLCESLELQTSFIFFVLSNPFEKYLKVSPLERNEVF